MGFKVYGLGFLGFRAWGVGLRYIKASPNKTHSADLCTPWEGSWPRRTIPLLKADPKP